jgi:hypothetical protein
MRADFSRGIFTHNLCDFSFPLIGLFFVFRMMNIPAGLFTEQTAGDAARCWIELTCLLSTLQLLA